MMGEGKRSLLVTLHVIVSAATSLCLKYFDWGAVA
jgi:hypothetical protein